MNKIKRRLIVEAKWVFEEEYHVDVSKYDIEVYLYKDNTLDNKYGLSKEYEVELTSKENPRYGFRMASIYVDENAVDSEKVEDFILQYTLEIC